MAAEHGALGLDTRDSEVLLCVSLTVNVCVLWSLAISAVCRMIRGRPAHSLTVNAAAATNTNNSQEDRPQIPCRRFTTNILFHLAMPICGFVILFKTDVLLNPFLTFDNKFRTVFSVSLGHYVFKIAEVILYRREVVHYKPLLVHHLVAIMTFSTILYFEQNPLLGVIALFLEGNLVFAELGEGDAMCALSHVLSSRLLKIAVVVGFIPAVVTKALVPGFLVVVAFTNSSGDLFKMDYVPLAFFFLGLVFFTAVNAWYFKDMFSEIVYHWRPSPFLPRCLIAHSRMPLTTVINHEGLSRLCHDKEHSVHIECNNLWGLEKAERCPGVNSEKNNMEVTTLGELFVEVDLGELSPAVISMVDNTHAQASDEE